MATVKDLREKWNKRAAARKRQKLLYRQTGKRGHLLTHRKHGFALRKLRDLIDRKLNSPQQRAVRWGARYDGMTEEPAGSNSGPKITKWQEEFGAWLVRQPWCGVFLGKCLKAAGVAVDSFVASVAAIEQHAKEGTHGFKSWHGPREGRKGDAVVIGGHGVHVEIVRFRIPGVGYATRGGNTSPGKEGSQANGGGVWPRIRTYSEVHGIARPDYPTH